MMWFVFTHQMASVQQVSLVQCKYCNRSFTTDALGRHEPVCMKGALKDRKQFDSHRQRMEGDNFTALRYVIVFSERELKFMFAICHRPSVCLSVVCLKRWCILLRRLKFSAIFLRRVVPWPSMTFV